eukprot:TRINITY_DN24838_c0_g1_i4.p1 TRINITY_DN24838_c0_g1~~TRINITY_DN24838_c0_g1_i4.p1  ORF type:complete len:130 (-),score=16.38 TRINITY_DN24838_c0_g1_i4:280-669(-)
MLLDVVPFIHSIINLQKDYLLLVFFFFFFKQKTAYEMLRSLVGSEMCIRDSTKTTTLARLSNHLKVSLKWKRRVSTLSPSSILFVNQNLLLLHSFLIVQGRMCHTRCISLHNKRNDEDDKVVSYVACSI